MLSVVRGGIIFGVASRQMDQTETVHEIAELFESEELIHDVIPGLINYCSLEETVSKLFVKWESRGNYIRLDRFKKDLGITDIRKQAPLDPLTVARYLGYVLNMVELYENVYPWSEVDSDLWYDKAEESIDAMVEIAERLLSQLGFKVESVPGTEYSLEVLVDDAGASEAIKIVESSDVKRDIRRYNCVDVCNDLDAKQKILASLYNDFEVRREELPHKGKGRLDNNFLGSVIIDIIDDAGNLFNNLGIRHNVAKNENSQFAVESMSDSKKIELYDRCYQLYVTTVLISKYINEHKGEIEKSKITKRGLREG